MTETLNETRTVSDETIFTNVRFFNEQQINLQSLANHQRKILYHQSSKYVQGAT